MIVAYNTRKEIYPALTKINGQHPVKRLGYRYLFRNFVSSWTASDERGNRRTRRRDPSTAESTGSHPMRPYTYRLIKVLTHFDIGPLSTNIPLGLDSNVSKPSYCSKLYNRTIGKISQSIHGMTCSLETCQSHHPAELSKRPELASNYNVTAYLAGIGQIFYGSYQLYSLSSAQLNCEFRSWWILIRDHTIPNHVVDKSISSSFRAWLPSNDPSILSRYSNAPSFRGVTEPRECTTVNETGGRGAVF